MMQWKQKLIRWLSPKDETSLFDQDKHFKESERVAMLNNVWAVPGFREFLGNNVFINKKRVIESDGRDMAALYYAQAYQQLLKLINRSHDATLQRNSIQREPVDK